MNSKHFYHVILFVFIMITIDEQELNKSLCGKCTNYIFEPDDTYGTWCIYYKDIYNAIRDGKIITRHKNEPIDRSVHYKPYGIVYCEGYKPK